MSTAIVLSGGGARGDFEVGVVRYLYERGIRPLILCGTSVGALNAIKLAEGENSSNPDQGFEGLAAIWATLQTNTDMYLDEAWLSEPKMDRRIANFLRGISADLSIDAPQKGGPWGIFQGFIEICHEVGFLVGDGTAVLESLDVIMKQARGLYNLNPISARLQSDFNPASFQAWVASGNKLRLAVVALESGRLRYVTETGHLIERDGSPVNDPTRVLPACRSIADDLFALESDIAAIRGDIAVAQEDLRSASPQSKSEIASQIKSLNAELGGKLAQAPAKRAELQRCTDKNPFPFQLSDIRSGVLASASIPGVFIPVKIGAEYYVDGGVREVIPIQAAVDLGATTIYSVSASSRNLPPFSTPASAGVLEIVRRSLTEISIDEVATTDRAVNVPAGGQLPTIFHIEPIIDIHDITTIDPGLIKISHDYGYMCAADTLDDVTNTRRGELASLIAQIRFDIWRMENAVAGQLDPTMKSTPPTPPNPGLQGQVDQKKQQLGALISERRSNNGPMPADIDHWTTNLELHPWRHLPQNDAAFIGQAVPTSIPQGGSVGVSVTMRNIGTTVWQSSKGYKLGSQSTQDNLIWGTDRQPLPHDVLPGAAVTFDFIIPAPPVGGATFQWQMLQEFVTWFGAPTEPVTIIVTPPQEPAICGTLREGIAEIQQQIRDLETSLTGDVRLDVRIRAAIAKLREQGAALRRQALASGCTV